MLLLHAFWGAMNLLNLVPELLYKLRILFPTGRGEHDKIQFLTEKCMSRHIFHKLGFQVWLVSRMESALYDEEKP